MTPELPLPALSTYGCVALLDDEEEFVDSIDFLLRSPRYSTVRFTEANQLHRHFEEVLPSLERERQLLLEIWRAQQETFGNVAELALKFFARPDRFELPLVLVTDFRMPGDDGVAVCSRYHQEGLERVLLTGVADKEIAVEAFNAGVIDQYVPKDAQHLPQDLVSAVERRLLHSSTRRASVLATGLCPRLCEALAPPGVGEALRRLMSDHGVQEYLMLAAPQGVLGITSKGEALWIQLETAASLVALDEVLEVAGFAPLVRQRVQAGEALLAADWMQLIEGELEEQAARVLSAEPYLVAAVHPLNLRASLRPSVPRR